MFLTQVFLSLFEIHSVRTWACFPWSQSETFLNIERISSSDWSKTNYGYKHSRIQFKNWVFKLNIIFQTDMNSTRALEGLDSSSQQAEPKRRCGNRDSKFPKMSLFVGKDRAIPFWFISTLKETFSSFPALRHFHTRVQKGLRATYAQLLYISTTAWSLGRLLNQLVSLKSTRMWGIKYFSSQISEQLFLRKDIGQLSTNLLGRK